MTRKREPQKIEWRDCFDNSVRQPAGHYRLHNVSTMPVEWQGLGWTAVNETEQRHHLLGTDVRDFRFPYHAPNAR